jgi:hypothetical protein
MHSIAAPFATAEAMGMETDEKQHGNITWSFEIMQGTYKM